MSLDRYLTLRYPLKYGRNKRRSLVAYKIITIWLISFAICLPLFILGLVDSSNVYNETTQACFPAHRTFKIYGSFIAFFIPLIIMIVTYTLTMTALHQAHTTKKQRKKGRETIHAVVNLAAMAIRWKRAVNTVEIPAGTTPSVISQQDTLSGDKNLSKTHQRKRSSSLITAENPKRSIFRSNQRLNELSKSALPILWHKRKSKQLKALTEKSSKNNSLSCFFFEQMFLSLIRVSNNSDSFKSILFSLGEQVSTEKSRSQFSKQPSDTHKTFAFLCTLTRRGK